MDFEQTSPFFAAVRDLARRHGVAYDKYVPEGTHDGYAVRLRAADASYTVLVLRGTYPPHCRLDQHLVLISRDGRFLDRISYAILNQWPWSEAAAPVVTAHVEVPATPEPDGARLVVRFD